MKCRRKTFTWDIEASNRAREVCIRSGLSVTDLVRMGCGCQATIYRLINGDVVRESVALRIIKALSREVAS